MGDVVPMKPNQNGQYKPIDHRRKLTDEQVAKMVVMRGMGSTYRELGEVFGVSTQTARVAVMEVLEPVKHLQEQRRHAKSERKRKARDPKNAQKNRDDVKAWREGNPERAKKANREYMKRRRVARTELLRHIKDAPCAGCEERYPQYVMQFDHRPGTRKLFNIGERYVSVSETVLMEEIAKCDIVCANCHAIRTHERRT